MSTLAKQNTFRAALIIEQCVRNGCTTIAIAPGSRSTPLTLAAAEHPDVTTMTHFDERGLAFWALGRAKATQAPVAIITTSGTAVANCLPALCEANLTNVTLIMISADRPEELHDIGANQTMSQDNLFTHHVKHSDTLTISNDDLSETELLNRVQFALSRSQHPQDPGPVHLNCQIRDPLYEPYAECQEDVKVSYADWKKHVSQKILPDLKIKNGLSLQEVKGVVQSGKGVMLVGDVTPDDADILLDLSQQLNLPIVADIQSGLYHLSVNREALNSVDWILVFGSRFVSKSLLETIEKTSEKQVWISPYSSIQNPTVETYSRWQISLADAASNLKRHIPHQESIPLQTPSYANSFYDNCIQTISQSITTQRGFIGNSSIVRRCDQVWISKSESVQALYTNRGVSGIDGNLATIAGLSHNQDGIVALLGDITTLHDMSSLALIQKSDSDITFIIFNDNGGRIFENLPIAEQTQHLEHFFVTPQNICFESVMKSHNISYVGFTSKNSQEELLKLLKKPGTKCIEIRLND